MRSTSGLDALPDRRIEDLGGLTLRRNVAYWPDATDIGLEPDVGFWGTAEVAPAGEDYLISWRAKQTVLRGHKKKARTTSGLSLFQLRAAQ
jgi:hypothetical protein